MTVAARPDTRRWMKHGTRLVADALDAFDEPAFLEPTALPGWTRAHLVAHLAGNAEAVGRLVHWAATGTPTPMYTSPQERAAGIEAGRHLPGTELVDWFDRSAAALAAAMDALTESQWATPVVTAQGRTVPASETPWMRTREVMVHAVDLGTGVDFSDLPADFLAALCDDIAGKRTATAGSPASGPALDVTASDTGDRWTVAGHGDPAAVTGTLAHVASYLSGRGAEGVRGPNGTAAPQLPAWL